MGVVGRVKNLLGPPAVTYDALNTKKKFSSRRHCGESRRRHVLLRGVGTLIS